MRVFLNEEQIAQIILETSTYNVYASQINDAKEKLNNYLSNYGEVMFNIENEKLYNVITLPNLSNAIGKQYCICRAINKENNSYGSIYVKPLKIFKTIY